MAHIGRAHRYGGIWVGVRLRLALFLFLAFGIVFSVKSTIVRNVLVDVVNFASFSAATPPIPVAWLGRNESSGLPGFISESKPNELMIHRRSKTDPGAAMSSNSASSAETESEELDFRDRCNGPGVVKCVGFDSQEEITRHMYPDSRGVARAVLDTEIKASGRGSLRFEIPTHSGQNSSGGWISDLGGSFGPRETLYVQYRQRFSPEFLATKYENAEGWKQAIFHMGTSTCAAMEIATSNTWHRGYPQMYTNCGGRSFDVDLHNNDFLYETGDYNCHRSNPNPHDCALYKANQWMTFYYEIKVGTWGKPNSSIKAWAGYEGSPLKQFENAVNYQLDFNSGPSDAFNAISLTPYNTGKSAAQDHPTAYTWYDELIVSRQPIPAPAQSSGKAKP